MGAGHPDLISVFGEDAVASLLAEFRTLALKGNLQVADATAGAGTSRELSGFRDVFYSPVHTIRRRHGTSGDRGA
jgi:lipid-binding SYLF domain-containing protein